MSESFSGQLTERDFWKGFNAAVESMQRRPDPIEDDPDLARCQDPVEWCGRVLDWHAWEMQAAILRSFYANPITAVKGCHSPGKTDLAAALTLHLTQTQDEALVITTAPTDRQVKYQLWAKIHRLAAKARSPIRGRLLAQELHVGPDVFAFGFTTNDKKPDRFQGFHAPKIYLIIDESSGVSEEIFTAIDAISTGDCHALQIGNPTNATGRFAKLFQTAGVSTFSMDAYSTPNFTAYGITEDDIRSGAWKEKYKGPIIPGLIDPQWVADMAALHGFDSPFYRSRVKALFPEQDDSALMSLGDVEACMDLELGDQAGPTDVVVDVARYGADETVIGMRRGDVLRIARVVQGCDTMRVAGEVVLAWNATPRDGRIRVDTIGVGAGVADRLREQKYPVLDMVASEASEHPDKYLNRRAEWWWTMAERVRAHAVQLPRDPRLLRDLTTVHYLVDSKGLIQIESKKDIKKRTGHSPDFGDMAVMAFAGGKRQPSFAHAGGLGTRAAAVRRREWMGF